MTWLDYFGLAFQILGFVLHIPLRKFCPCLHKKKEDAWEYITKKYMTLRKPQQPEPLSELVFVPLAPREDELAG